jgi:hypothetical protein
MVTTILLSSLLFVFEVTLSVTIHLLISKWKEKALAKTIKSLDKRLRYLETLQR